MSVHTTVTFDDPVTREVYAYVERAGAATVDDLARSIEVPNGPPASKPARSGTHVRRAPPDPERIEAAVESLTADGYLVERDGTLRVALSADPVERDCDGTTVRIRPVREDEREALVATMRVVSADGPHVVAADVASRIERESAVVRATGERSRVCFVAEAVGDGIEESGTTAEAEGEAAADGEPAATLLGWIHLDVPGHEPLAHTASLTVGVREGARRRGIATALVEYGRDWAETAGLRKCCQAVPATNERALAFLTATGWEREGVRSAHYRLDGDLVDEVQFATWPGGRPG